jgi:hypothetical protein
MSGAIDINATSRLGSAHLKPLESQKVQPNPPSSRPDPHDHEPHNRLEAIRAPSRSASNLAHITLGCTSVQYVA